MCFVNAHTRDGVCRHEDAVRRLDCVREGMFCKVCKVS